MPERLRARFARAVAGKAEPPRTWRWEGGVPTQDPSLSSNTPAAVEPPPPAVEQAPAAARQPRRRRWLPPSDPAERAAEPLDPPPPKLYPCPHCGQVHQPVELAGTSLWARPLLAPARDNDGDTSSLVRDQFASPPGWGRGRR